MPVVVPGSSTLTKGSGSSVDASVTRPRMRVVWAAAASEPARNSSDMASDLNMSDNEAESGQK